MRFLSDCTSQTAPVISTLHQVTHRRCTVKDGSCAAADGDETLIANERRAGIVLARPLASTASKMLSGHGAIIEIWLMVVWNSNTNVEAIAPSYMTCLSRQKDQAGMGVRWVKRSSSSHQETKPKPCVWSL